MTADNGGALRAQPVQLRSYRAVFELEYRIYRVQRWALPFARGVALSTICWTMGAAVAILVLRRVPGIGAALGVLPDALRYIGIPAAIGIVMSRYRPDGRPLHRFIGAVLRHRGSARVVDAFGPSRPAWRTERLVGAISMRVGATSPRYRNGRLCGPAVVALRGQAELRVRGGCVELVASDEPPRQRPRWLVLEAGQTLRVRTAGRRALRRAALPTPGDSAR
jgi:hypothetical protein